MKYRGEHFDFIHEPLKDILDKAVISSNVLGNGIETYPISDYVFQTMFLKMTGAQEQKLKCIWWDISTFDYDFRREFLYNQGNISECSSEKSKGFLYGKLCDYLEKKMNGASVISDTQKNSIIVDAINDVKTALSDSILIHWNQKMFQDFLFFKNRVRPNHFCTKKNLLQNPLKQAYECLYNSRNRYAHNTLSYQRNMPSFVNMSIYKSEHNSFYVWFFLLILLDKAFVHLYDTYFSILEENN